MERKKLALLLVNRQFIRSWLDSGLVHFLENVGEYEVTIFANSEIHARLPVSAEYRTCDLGVLPISKKTKHLVAMGFVQMSSMSPTFRFKLIRQFLPETLLITKFGNLKSRIIWLVFSLRRAIGNTLNNWITICYFLPPFRAIVRVYLKLLNERPRLPVEIASNNFDWLLIPSASAIGYTTDFLEGANAVGLKTLIAIDNWDHLTGKSIYPIKPDYFTVMGKRCVEHAVEIHNCDASRVLPIGLPRFDLYREIQHECTPRPSLKKKRVLYCGFSLAHAENRIVSSLADYLDSKYGVGVIEVHYRPHPGPMPRYDGSTISNSGIQTTSYGDLQRTAMPEMDAEFIQVLQEADVVIGAPTTLMLEALALKKKSVLDLTHDGFHRTTSAISSFRHTHMRDLLSIEGLPHANSIIELNQIVDLLLLQPDPCMHLDISSLYDASDSPYRNQLLSFLKRSDHSKIMEGI